MTARPRTLLSLPSPLRLLVALIVLTAAIASGSTVAAAETAVAANHHETVAAVAVDTNIPAGHVGSNTVSFDDWTSGCCVAPQTPLDRARAARDQAGLKPDGTPNRNSPAYVGGHSSDGSVMGTGNVGTGPNAIHAEDVIQDAMPGAGMTEPYAWRRNPETLELEWQPFTVCPRCQSRYPEELFEPGTNGAPGGAWDE